MDIGTLIALANRFDEAGEEAKANMIDELIKKVAAGEKLDLDEEQKILKEDEKVNKELGEIPIETNILPEQTKTRLVPNSEMDINYAKHIAEKLSNAVFALNDLKDCGFEGFVGEDISAAKHAINEVFTKLIPLCKASNISAEVKLQREGSDHSNVFKKLAEIADTLDASGAVEEANMIDEFITANAAKDDKKDPYDSKQHHSEQIREPKRDQERKDRDGHKNHHVHTYQETGAAALQTRYCPEHIGDMLGRVGDGVFQCPRDGAIYNFETGWTDYNGVKHPGGSVAGQTPSSTEYAIPHRLFDSREKIMNVIN